jgi:hypothetical protein
VTTNVYEAAWAAAARYAAAPVPRPFALSRGLPLTLPTTGNVIYIACNAAGRVIYVGSSVRTLRIRVGEHVRRGDRARNWDTLWVIPLRSDTSTNLVRLVEGRVGRLLRPTGNGRLPRC